jgi:putrescine aminotransferase
MRATREEILQEADRYCDWITKPQLSEQEKDQIVRGKGLLIGLEYPSDVIGYAVSQALFQNRILVGGTLNNARVFRIEPPSVIRYDEIDRVISTLDRVLGEVEQEFHGQC